MSDAALARQIPASQFKPPSAPNAPARTYTRNVMADLERNKSDPAYVAAYMSELQKPGSAPQNPSSLVRSNALGMDLVAEHLFAHGPAVEPLPGLPPAGMKPEAHKALVQSSRELKQDQATFAAALTSSLDRGTLSYRALDLRVNRHEAVAVGGKAGPNPWTTVADAMCIPNRDVYARVDATAAQVSVAQVKLADATSKAEEADEQLALELASFGDALTEQQVQQYVKAFHADPKHKTVYANQAAAQRELAAVFEQHPVEVLAAISDRGQAGPVFEGMKALAGTPEAEAVLRFGAPLAADPFAVKAMSGYDLTNEVLGESLPFYGASMLGKPPGSVRPEEVLAPWKGLVDPSVNLDGALRKLSTLSSTPPPGKLPGPNFHGTMDPLKGIADGTLKPFEADLPPSFGDKWNALSLLYAVHGAGTSTSLDSQLKWLSDASSATAALTPSTLRSVAGALAETGNSAKAGGGPLLRGAAKVETFNKFAGPLLGALSSALSYTGHLKAPAGTGRNLGLAGDALTLTGSLMTFASGLGYAALGPWGAGLVAVGGLVSSTGDLIANDQANRELRKAQRDHLSAIGLGDSNLMDGLQHADPDQIQLLRQGLGLSAEQVQEVARLAPYSLSTADGVTLAQRAQTLGLTGDQFLGLVRAVEAHPVEGDPGRSTYNLDLALGHMPLSTDAELRAERRDHRQARTELLASLRATAQTDPSLTPALQYLESLPQERIPGGSR
ncbi:hypothetical protein [Hyalangium sp.]|uniref:hypothetical protein n=1 Tax=Hyalangium sp. TaxID=2028555 RepID=UPI002D5E6856|nr:hypothetical protein [Hyalangium sp.]HYI01722.1 hypothetical protein [Hyalangium sp.]